MAIAWQFNLHLLFLLPL